MYFDFFQKRKIFFFLVFLNCAASLLALNFSATLESRSILFLRDPLGRYSRPFSIRSAQ